MNTPLPDLGDLLHDAVDGIEPADRIEAIRDRTAASPAHAARPWFYAAGGVVLATAATVAAFALLGDSSGPDRDHDMATTPTGTQVVPVYFIGDSPRGDRLFREYDEVPAGDPLQAALDRMERPPSDPDYRTPWTTSSFGSATLRDDGIDVELEDGTLDDDLSAQQVVYTLQAAVGERLPVQLVRDGEPVGEPLTAQSDVLNLVMINDPTEGLAVGAGFTARGAANSFEATVPWEIRDESDQVVKQGYATATGWMDKLYPWHATIDVRDLPPGFYTFVAMTADPSGGAEGSGPFSDTRTIVVR